MAFVFFPNNDIFQTIISNVIIVYTNPTALSIGENSLSLAKAVSLFCTSRLFLHTRRGDLPQNRLGSFCHHAAHLMVLGSYFAEQSDGLHSAVLQFVLFNQIMSSICLLFAVKKRWYENCTLADAVGGKCSTGTEKPISPAGSLGQGLWRKATLLVLSLSTVSIAYLLLRLEFYVFPRIWTTIEDENTLAVYVSTINGLLIADLIPLFSLFSLAAFSGRGLVNRVALLLQYALEIIFFGYLACFLPGELPFIDPYMRVELTMIAVHVICFVVERRHSKDSYFRYPSVPEKRVKEGLFKA